MAWADRWMVTCFFLCIALNGVSADSGPVRDPRAYFFTPTFGDLREDLDDARSTGKLGLLLFFEQEGCAFCKRMMKTVLNQPDVQDWYRERFIAIAVDINGDVELTDVDGVTLPSKVFAAHRKVKTTPTLSFLDLNGSEVHRRTAMIENPEEFLLVGRYVADGHYTDTSWKTFEREQQRSANESVVLPMAEDLRAEATSASAIGGYLLLAVTRQGCPYCASLRRDVLVPMTKSGDYEGSLRVREMMIEPESPVKDFDGSPTTTANVAARYGVGITPTVLLLDGTGELLSDPIVGFNNADSYGFRLDRAFAQARSARGLSTRQTRE
jgi:thioredoxin-related protein